MQSLVNGEKLVVVVSFHSAMFQIVYSIAYSSGFIKGL